MDFCYQDTHDSETIICFKVIYMFSFTVAHLKISTVILKIYENEKCENAGEKSCIFSIVHLAVANLSEKRLRV